MNDSQKQVSDEIRATVNALIDERVRGALSDSMLEKAIADAVTRNVKLLTEQRAADINAKLLSTAETIARLWAEKLLSGPNAPAAIEVAFAKAIERTPRIAELIREEIEKSVKGSVGQQVAARMRRFFEAVDKLLINDR